MRVHRIAVAALLAVIGAILPIQQAAHAGPGTTGAGQTMAPARDPSVPADWSGPHRINANGTNMVMAVANSGGSNSRVIIWPFGNHKDQWWYFEPIAGGYFLRPYHNSALCLDVPGASTPRAPT